MNTRIASAIKPLSFFVLLAATLICCNDNKQEDAQAVTGADSLAVQSPKQQLISELKNLRAALTSKNKEQVQAALTFPLTDTTMSLYADDPKFNEEKDRNNGLVTKEMFIKYFDKLEPVLQLDDMDSLFAALPLDSLAFHDTLEREIRIKTEACYRYYQIEKTNDIVTLRFGTNSNTDYVRPANSDENDFGCAEWTQIWEFRFDGTKLIFLRQALAG